MMMQLIEEKDTYLASFSQFEKELGKPRQAPIHKLRQEAIERFVELGFPTLKDEDWRFTNVAALAKVPFQMADGHGDVRALLVGQLPKDALCLVFVNGVLAPKLSSRKALPDGVTLASLAEILEKDPALVEPHLARLADFEDHAFTALNTAFLRDGTFLHLAKNAVLPEPVHLVHVSVPGDKPCASHPRILVVAERGSQATVVESYLGTEDGVYFTNAVAEVVLGPGANLDWYKVQEESLRAFHIATMQVKQDRDSQFSCHSVVMGGSLVRNDVNAVLAAEGCTCTLNGLSLASGKQHMDNHTMIDHAMPHCASHELYKCVLDGQAHGVFNGKIFVRQDAQKTDAKQTNQTLLLSEDAVMDTKPQLEIFADDVKCTHGATVGNLSEDEIFYLRSRGIGRDEARSLLTYAFANDIIDRIKVDGVRERLSEMLLRGNEVLR